nr:retrovirus-related Pol polyprotein from transposon TNT 1-94 [Tanacetum cinerariifolium]
MNANQLKALKEKRMKAKTALYLLFQSVNESGFEKIVGASTAKQAWDTLEKAYKGTDRVKQVRLQTLRGKLEAIKMKEAKGALDYITRVQMVVNQLKLCALEEAKDPDELTIEELAGSLKGHKQRKNRKKQESLDEALQTKATIKEEKALYAQWNNYSRGNNTRGRNTNQGHDRGRDNNHQVRQQSSCQRSTKRTEENTNLVTEPDVEEGGVLLMAHEEPVSEVDMIWKLLLKNREGSFRALVNMCKNHTFKLDPNSVGEKCLRSDLTDKESVWHLRLGHLHFNGLKELAKKNMVHGVSNLNYDDHLCEDCVLGKQTRSSFPRNASYRVKELLELIHSDLCGPLSPISFGNKRLYDPIEKKVTVIRDEYVNEETTSNEQADFENKDEPVQQRTRSLQDLHESTTEMHLVCLVADTENITFEEAIRSEKWKKAIDVEINAIERNKTWEMAQLPKGQKPIGVKWEYRKKMNVEGEVYRELVAALYVDDLIFTGNNKLMIDQFKESMTQEFEMTDLGLMKYFLGLEVRQETSEIFISQEAYAKEILKKSKIENSNTVATPMELGTKLSKFEGGELVDANLYQSLVGSLRYLTSTRPNLSYSVGVVSHFMENPKYAHLKALKRILRYVKGTKSLGLFYSSSKEYRLNGYSNSDWHGDVDDRKSTSGYVFFMREITFTWALKKQPIVALSTCEAEYVAASWIVCHAIWLRNLLQELKNQQDGPTEIKVDNKSAIELARNSVHHERSKHIIVSFHFIKEHIRNREVQLTHVMSRDQAANIFTKALPAELFNLCKQKIGMKDARDVSLMEEFISK